jgi:hypothetical protein
MELKALLPSQPSAIALALIHFFSTHEQKPFLQGLSVNSFLQFISKPLTGPISLGLVYGLTTRELQFESRRDKCSHLLGNPDRLLSRVQTGRAVKMTTRRYPMPILRRCEGPRRGLCHQSPAYPREDPGSIPDQSMWDLSWTKWYLDRFLPGYFRRYSVRPSTNAPNSSCLKLILSEG